MTRAELQAAAQDTNTPMLEVAICSVFANSAKHGDYARLAFLLDRAVGKPREVEDDSHEDRLASMTDDELVAHVEEIIAKRKGSAA